MRKSGFSVVALAILTASASAWGQTSASFPPVEGEESPSPPAPSPPAPAPAPPVVEVPAPVPPAPVATAPGPTADSTLGPAASAADPYGIYAPVPAQSLTPSTPTGPRYLPYEPGMEVPEGYRVRRRRLKGLMVSGGVTFGASYLYAFGSGASQGFENGETWLVLPVIGPFAALAARKLDKCDIEVDDTTVVVEATKTDVERCFKDSLREALRLAVITADGVLQTVGASLFVGGAVGGEKRLVKAQPRVTAGPEAFGKRGFGFGVRGTF
jgi:hypothetical protein